MPDEYVAGQHDHRGTTGAPPEGRREADPAHAMLAEKLAAFEAAAKHAETTARKTRSIILTITVVFGAVVSLTTWLGSKNLGPGARADAIEAKVDRNLEYAQRSDSVKGKRDSIQDVSIARIVEGMQINAYQICMTQTHSDGPKCNQIMSHSFNP